MGQVTDGVLRNSGVAKKGSGGGGGGNVVDAYAVDALTVNVKINEGVGNGDKEYSVYANDTQTVNDLTMDGVIRSSADAGETAEVQITRNDSNITVSADENGCDIVFANEKDIKTIEITASAQKNVVYNCFKNGTDTIYFLNGCPFVPRLNTDGTPYSYNGLSFTYYTKENNEMVSHSFTTDSSGDNICGYSENGEVKFSAYSSGADLENIADNNIRKLFEYR